LGDELLEFWVGAEIFQIGVGHQTVGIFVSAIEGFLQILKGVIGTVGGGRDTGEGVPDLPGVSQSFGVALPVDGVVK
jgi:hypothetical protein